MASAAGGQKGGGGARRGRGKSGAPVVVDAPFMEKLRRANERGVRGSLQRFTPGSKEDEEEIPLEAAIFCHVFVLNSVLERLGNRVAEAHHLTLPQWMALGAIGHAPGGAGLTHSELGQQLMLSKAPITGVVDRLERAGFVTRTTSERDRRVSRVQITAEGAQVWRSVRDSMRVHSSEHCAFLEESEREVLLSLLARLLQSVAASDPMLSVVQSPATEPVEPVNLASTST